MFATVSSSIVSLKKRFSSLDFCVSICIFDNLFFFNMSFERAGYQKKKAVFEMYNFRADLVEFWSTKVYNVFMEHKSLEVTPRTGRPTDARKEFALKVRVDAKLHERIVDYAEEKNVTKAEVVRKALDEYLPKK